MNCLVILLQNLQIVSFDSLFLQLLLCKPKQIGKHFVSPMFGNHPCADVKNCPCSLIDAAGIEDESDQPVTGECAKGQLLVHSAGCKNGAELLLGQLQRQRIVGKCQIETGCNLGIGYLC